MSHHDDDLQPIADRLRASRPELTALELDDISQRVRARVAARKRPRGTFMKSRLTILAMLVAGMLLSTTGAGLAVSGLTSQGDAGLAQYGEATPPPPTAAPPAAGAPAPAPSPQSEVLGEEEESAPAPAAAAKPAPAVQPARQVEAAAKSGELPFTGFAALPILLGGLALLTTGLVLRRRTHERRD